MNINDFLISGKLKAELESVMAARRLPHAVIIENADEEQRLGFAFFLSAASLCEGSGTIPCGACRHCKKIGLRIHPDVNVFERESGKKEFSVKIVRDSITPSVFIKPNEADGRVCIIKDAHTMNASAQNAFLKILEEPPAGVRFILLCDAAVNMLETIRSRAVVYSMQSSSGAKSQQLAEAEDCAQGLALSLLSHTEYDFMAQTGVLEKDREMTALVLSRLQIIFRNAVFIKNSQDVGSYSEAEKKLAGSVPLSNLLKLIEKTNELNSLLNKNANLNLLITRICSVLRQSARG